MKRSVKYLSYQFADPSFIEKFICIIDRGFAKHHELSKWSIIQ